MALQINVAMTTKDGGAINTGAIVRFMTIFPEAGTQIHYNMNVYRGAEQVTTGYKIKDQIVEIPSMGYVESLSEEDYTSLTPEAVHTKLKNYLESLDGIGVGNVSII